MWFEIAVIGLLVANFILLLGLRRRVREVDKWQDIHADNIHRYGMRNDKAIDEGRKF